MLTGEQFSRPCRCASRRWLLKEAILCFLFISGGKLFHNLILLIVKDLPTLLLDLGQFSLV